MVLIKIKYVLQLLCQWNFVENAVLHVDDFGRLRIWIGILEVEAEGSRNVGSIVFGDRNLAIAYADCRFVKIVGNIVEISIVGNGFEVGAQRIGHAFASRSYARFRHRHLERHCFVKRTGTDG